MVTVKILITDDETDLELLIRQRFRKQIRDKAYEFLFAHNGLEALEILKADPSIQLVLSDINMPVMDGLELLSRIKEHDTMIQPVIVSAYGDMTNIRTAMNRGAFDFLTKPIDFADFETTVTKTLSHCEALRQAAETRTKLSVLQRELDLACQIQQSILPKVFPPFPGMTAADIHAIMLPARNVGGDFYDFFLIEDDKLAVVIGDVSGKGMPAAIFMAMSRTLLKAVASRSTDPGACLTEVNTLLCRDNNAEMFVTLFYGVLDAGAGTFSYSNGGHNPPYLLRPSSPPAQLEMTGNMMLGMIEGQEYNTRQVPIKSGDLLFLYTDGVTEAMDPASNQFTERRLEEYLRGAATGDTDSVIKGIVEAVRLFAGGAPQSDDLTALALRYRR
ncbi:fused response regulator/phosphatase [Planctomycetaceae bacterium SCGC AG-212-D15]|nr:fused response regulator/phosphatase [Planctomycetaceae bacterium SCGC AG-212-D15]